MLRNNCHKLGLGKSHVLEVEAKFGRFPVIANNPLCNFGSRIKYFLEKMPESNRANQVYSHVKKR